MRADIASLGPLHGPAAFPILGVEVRLGGRGPMDFGAAVASLGPGRELLAHATDPAWAAAAAFCRSWPEVGGVSILFVERDAPDSGGGAGLFARVDPAPKVGSLDDLTRVAEALTGVPPSMADRSALQTLIGELGAYGRLLHVGGIPARGTGLRLVLTVHQDDLYSVLLGAGVPLGMDVLRDLDRVLEAAPDWLDVHLDLQDGRFGTRVGLELSFGGQPPDDARWAAVLTHWTAMEWAHDARCRDVLAWAGSARDPDAPGRALRRELSHLKVALGRGAPEAKAYLGLRSGLG